MNGAPNTIGPDDADYDADDASKAADNDSGLTESKKPQYSLRNRKLKFQKCSQHQNKFKNITDAPDGDAKVAADGDADHAPNNDDYDAGSTDSKESPYSFRNYNHSPMLLMMMLTPPMMLTPQTLS